MKKSQDPNYRVERFLSELGEPVDSQTSRKGIAGVWDRLQTGVDGPLKVSHPVAVAVSQRRWGTIAAAALLMLTGGIAQLLWVQPRNMTTIATVSSGDIKVGDGIGALRTGARIEAGQIVHAGSKAGTVSLLDGSRLEMSPDAELSISPADDGVRVFLTSGTLIVTATKQRNGHLYVQTKDLEASVVGTVFSVAAEAGGSRVSVIEGEVHVQQGNSARTLLPGEQTSSNPAIPLPPVQTEIAWSPRAPELVALLLQPVQLAQPAAVPAGAVVRGIVRQSNGEALSGVDVRLCTGPLPPDSNAGAAFRLPPRSEISEIRIRTFRAESPQDQAGTPTVQSTPTYWYGTRTCPGTLRVTTSSDGTFQFANVDPGQYYVRAEREGYWAGPANGVYFPAASEAFMIDTPAGAKEISLVLNRGGVITGRVRDMNGNLLPNAPVWAGPPSSNNDVSTWVVAASRVTDDRGEFRLFGLAPGEYRVAAGLPGSTEARTAVYLRAGAQTSVGWNTRNSSPAFFFGNNWTLKESVPVIVAAGEEVQNIDIVVSPPAVQWNVAPAPAGQR